MNENSYSGSSAATLIATLGGQPQVVTFALDALLARGEQITEVYLVHLSLENPRTRQALHRLQQEFLDDHYAGRRCRLRRAPIQANGQALTDIRTAADAEATWQSIRNLIAELKNEGRRLHLCLSGGRRMMALLAMSAAALLCDHQDRIWHMHTPEETLRRVKDGAVMHVTPADGVQLIPTPLAPWGAYFPALRTLAQTSMLAAQEQLRLFTALEDPACRRVWEQLTPRRRDVLRAFAEGKRPDEVAAALSISLSTVNTHKTAILNECRVAWGLPEDEPLDYRFLRERFARFVQQV
ncbi:MAG: histidine kinase [Pirellulaceae bacterium]|uniref:CRISPR-associated ring nuclease n=1 Tax=Caldilinea sp. TaxID=2293560 RepID=UPI0021DC9F5D|nr:CRISPR-associated ring nuclease [uncultured Caldilinea sp.]GIW89785.1 MAG: histidine kinase [Pirellulaceae bacterium]